MSEVETHTVISEDPMPSVSERESERMPSQSISANEMSTPESLTSDFFSFLDRQETQSKRLEVVPTGKVDGLEQRVSSPEYAENITRLCSSTQREVSRMNGLAGGLYTSNVLKLLRTAGSIEEAHLMLEKDAWLLHDGKHPAPGVDFNRELHHPVSVIKGDTKWTVTDKIQKDRVVLMIEGQAQTLDQEKCFNGDLVSFRRAAEDLLGVPKDHVHVLKQPSVKDIENALKELTKEGKQIIVYYTGHGVIDHKATSDRPDGRVTGKEIRAINKDRAGIEPEGTSSGALFLQGTDIGRKGGVLLHEHALIRMLNEVSPSFSGGVILMSDACFAGSLSNKHHETDRK